MGQVEVLTTIGVCSCTLVVAVSVTLVIIAVLNRGRMIKNSRDTWMRR